MRACKVCGEQSWGTYFCDDHASMWGTSPEFRALNITASDDEYRFQVDAFTERVRGEHQNRGHNEP